MVDASQFDAERIRYLDQKADQYARKGAIALYGMGTAERRYVIAKSGKGTENVYYGKPTMAEKPQANMSTPQGEGYVDKSGDVVITKPTIQTPNISTPTGQAYVSQQGELVRLQSAPGIYKFNDQNPVEKLYKAPAYSTIKSQSTPAQSLPGVNSNVEVVKEDTKERLFKILNKEPTVIEDTLKKSFPRSEVKEEYNILNSPSELANAIDFFSSKAGDVVRAKDINPYISSNDNQLLSLDVKLYPRGGTDFPSKDVTTKVYVPEYKLNPSPLLASAAVGTGLFVATGPFALASYGYRGGRKIATGETTGEKVVGAIELGLAVAPVAVKGVKYLKSPFTESFATGEEATTFKSVVLNNGREVVPTQATVTTIKPDTIEVTTNRFRQIFKRDPIDVKLIRGNEYVTKVNGAISETGESVGLASQKLQGKNTNLIRNVEVKGVSTEIAGDQISNLPPVERYVAKEFFKKNGVSVSTEENPSQFFTGEYRNQAGAPAPGGRADIRLLRFTDKNQQIAILDRPPTVAEVPKSITFTEVRPINSKEVLSQRYDIPKPNVKSFSDLPKSIRSQIPEETQGFYSTESFPEYGQNKGDIYIKSGLSKEEYNSVLRHESGHYYDDVLGSTNNLKSNQINKLSKDAAESLRYKYGEIPEVYSNKNKQIKELFANTYQSNVNIPEPKMSIRITKDIAEDSPSQFFDVASGSKTTKSLSPRATGEVRVMTGEVEIRNIPGETDLSENIIGKPSKTALELKKQQSILAAKATQLAASVPTPKSPIPKVINAPPVSTPSSYFTAPVITGGLGGVKSDYYGKPGASASMEDFTVLRTPGRSSITGMSIASPATQEFKPTTNTVFSSRTNQFQNQPQSQTQPSSSQFKPIMDDVIKFRDIQVPVQTQTPREQTRQEQPQPQEEQQKLLLKVKTILKTPNKLQTPKTTEQIIPKTPTILTPRLSSSKVKSPTLKSSSVVSKAFKVITYRKGKEVTLGENLPEGKALKLGSDNVRKTLGASFKLVAQGSTSQEDIPFSLSGEVFRPGKRDSSRFVQRSKYRLSAGSEVTEILGAKRRKKKSNGFFNL